MWHSQSKESSFWLLDVVHNNRQPILLCPRPSFCPDSHPPLTPITLLFSTLPVVCFLNICVCVYVHIFSDFFSKFHPSAPGQRVSLQKVKLPYSILVTTPPHQEVCKCIEGRRLVLLGFWLSHGALCTRMESPTTTCLFSWWGRRGSVTCSRSFGLSITVCSHSEGCPRGHHLCSRTSSHMQRSLAAPMHTATVAVCLEGAVSFREINYSRGQPSQCPAACLCWSESFWRHWLVRLPWTPRISRCSQRTAAPSPLIQPRSLSHCGMSPCQRTPGDLPCGLLCPGEPSSESRCAGWRMRSSLLRQSAWGTDTCGVYACSVTSVMSDSLWPHGLYPPGSSVHGILQKNTGVGCHSILQGILPTQGSNQYPYIFCIGRWVLYH